MRDSLIRCRDRFRGVPVERDASRPLIGVVGEIFCRLNRFPTRTFSGVSKSAAAKAWLSDIAEWVWYTNIEQFRLLELAGRRFSLDALGLDQGARPAPDEHTLLEPFNDEFRGYEEPDIGEVLDAAAPTFRPTAPWARWSSASARRSISHGKVSTASSTSAPSPA